MKAFSYLILLGLIGIALGSGGVQNSEVDHEAEAETDETVQTLHVGYPVKFTCNFTSSEAAESASEPKSEAQTAIKLKWFKDDEEIVVDDRLKIFQDNFTLLIMKAEKDDVGDYKCETDTGGDTLSRTIKLIFLEIRKMDKSLNVVEREELSIECPTDGNPPPTVSWLKNQKPIVEMMANDSRISMTPNSKNIPNGTLTISNSQWSDRGNYSCIIKSFQSSYEKWTFLRVKDVYAALWPFIGIVVEVVILGIIIVIFEKRRAKAEFDESDTDQGNDQKNKGKDRRR